ncbi:hypothetical protein [Vibrio sp. D431a]|uniref:hypothetical protein n=1 Tax=Vibrio sp. D431a TaxID=2837388 RepID=UPI002554FFF5|nr:hypothetical protein [Vibrio sp. D431a]MDK9790593.1 hypothetical protein [Vibrio sp. D431a]
MSDRLSTSDAKEIRKRLNAAYSSVIVYGTGLDVAHMPTFSMNSKYQDLVSESKNKKTLWKWFLENGADAQMHPFFHKLREMNEDTKKLGIPNFSTHYILKTSVLNTMSDLESTEGFNLLELNGNAFEAFDPSQGQLLRINSPKQLVDGLENTFPKGNYDSKKRVVANFESAYVNDLINIAVFIGTSGRCPVVESMYNRALVNKAFIVVVNTDKQCFMHDLANVSLTCDAQQFLDDLNTFYVTGELNEQ